MVILGAPVIRWAGTVSKSVSSSGLAHLQGLSESILSALTFLFKGSYIFGKKLEVYRINECIQFLALLLGETVVFIQHGGPVNTYSYSYDGSVLGFSYTGNRMTGAADSVSQESFAFACDADGNRTSDGRTGLEFSYNILNLPCEVYDGQQNMRMRYTYLSDGTKVSAFDIAEPESEPVYERASFQDQWFVKDHLGNVRSVIDLSATEDATADDVILEQNDYLPFGTRLPGSRTDQSNRYRLGGKEEQDIAGMDLGLLDFGARYYDAFVGRWNAIDPLAHKYFGMSPYNYCGNDPVNRFDPDGNAWFQNTSTGEIYYNESYTQQDVGKGIMRGDSNWSYLADNDSFSILDSELLTQFSQFVQEDNNSFGVLFNAESAASTMDKVGLEFKPTQALVEVHTDTQSIAEGDIVVTLENEFCIVKDIEKGKYVPRDFKQTTSTRIMRHLWRNPN